MSSREWRKCETCEWITWVGKEGYCTNIKAEPVIASMDSDSISRNAIINNGCSEWKSAEPETCGMCEWFLPFGNAPKGVCNHSMSQPRNYSSRLGACEYFRRKDAY